MTPKQRLLHASDQMATGMLRVGHLAIADRRWSALMLASALAFGLFIGTALGPASQFSEAGSLVAVEGSVPVAAEEPADTVATDSSGGGSGSSDTSDTTTTPAPAPVIPAPVPAPIPAPAPAPAPPPPGGGGGGGGGGGKGLILSGVVLATNPSAESYALSDGGQLYAIHTEKLPTVGAELDVPVVDLANGSYAEDGDREDLGEAEDGVLEGLVTYVREGPESPAYTVSAPGVSLLVHAPDAAELPTVGQFVIADVSLEQVMTRRQALRKARRLEDIVGGTENGPTGSCERTDVPERPKPAIRLVESSLEPSGDEYTYGDLAGIVEAICPETGRMAITADGRGESGATIQLAVPDGFDTSTAEVDEAVVATATLEAGMWTLAGLASDAGQDGADDETQLEGDLEG